MNLDALTDEVLARCDELGTLSDEPGRLTRTFLGPAMRKAHERITHWMVDADLVTHVDAVGNVHGVMPNSKTAKLFLVGSHIDTVPNAGKYDGPLGLLLGIAAAKALRGQSFRKRMQVIAFSEEEGVRFRFPYIGSLAAAGKLTAKMLERKDADGVSLTQAIQAFGLNPKIAQGAAFPPGTVAGYLEAHIEQGPVLESKGLPLAIVTSIMGQTRGTITFTGMAGHAGTQPMNLRRDALVGAAEFVLFVAKHGQTVPGLRATVGTLTVMPNAGNVVPGEVRLSLDVRHESDEVRTEAADRFFTQAQVIGGERKLAVQSETILNQTAVSCDVILTQRLGVALWDEDGIPERIVSGAGHDATVMAGVCPTAMLFIRSPGGISHHPDESVRREDVRMALGVMVRFLEAELNR